MPVRKKEIYTGKKERKKYTGIDAVRERAQFGFKQVYTPF
jgi:hypothetical protein